MEIRVLGPLRVEHQGRPLDVGGKQRRTLLALLAVHANEAVSAGYLIDQIWGESPPPAARKSLQSHVAHLRRVLNLGHDLLRAQPPGYVLALEPDALDSLLFQNLLRKAVNWMENDPAMARDELDAALDMWRGPALADVADESPTLRVEVTRLEEMYLLAREQQAEANLLLGNHLDAIADLEQLVAQNPLRERLRAQLMLALYRSGRQADALATFQDARRSLAEELGIEPSRELQDLEERILLQTPDLDLAPLRHPPAGLATQASGNDPLSPNFPVPVSSFIGRSTEIGFLIDNLESARLLTITGAGGSGKTRLALQVTARAEGFPDGVWVVALAGLEHPDLVTQEVARALDLREQPANAWSELLRSHFADRVSLLLLDNCEHLLAPVSRLCRFLLESAPGLRILATSREPLRVPGETTWQIPLLSHPPTGRRMSLQDLELFESTQLFVARARSARPDLVLSDDDANVIADICRRLDGLPLALELAAARVRAMSLGEIASHLDDRFGLLSDGDRAALPRQQTLTATIAWSYDLLSPDEQRLFERLSVFRGGFEMDAAVAVAGEHAIAGIASLVDKSMLTAEPAETKTRYRMLETLASFARAGLGERIGEAEKAHLAWATTFARVAAANLEGTEQAIWVGRVQTEIDNIRAALEAALRHGEHTAGLDIVSSLFNYWYMRGVGEGRGWVDRFLDADPAVPEDVMAWSLFVGGALRHQEGEHESEAAGAMLGRSLEIFRQIGDPHGIAYAIHHLARTHWGLVDPDMLRVEFKTAFEGFSEVEDWVGVATSLAFMVWVELEYGTAGNAVEVAEELFEMTRRVGSPNLEAHGSELLATARWNSDDYEGAGPLLLEAIQLYREVGNSQCAAHCLDSVAAWTLGTGDPEGAAVVLAAVDELREAIGVEAPRWERFIPNGVRTKLVTILGEDALERSSGGGEASGLDETLELGLKTVTAHQA